MAKYQCPGCGYTYDETAGHDFEGFPPGTLWSDVTEDWSCPDCAVRDKIDFELVGGTKAPAPEPAPEPALKKPAKKDKKPSKPATKEKPGKKAKQASKAKPAPVKKPKPTKKPAANSDAYQKWICLTCGHIYYEKEGDPFEGVPVGTRFADVPDSWICPDCGTVKEDYILFEEE